MASTPHVPGLFRSGCVTVHRSEVLRLYREPRGRTPSARVVRRSLRIARKQHSDDGTASVGTAHQLRMDISGFQQSPAGVQVSWYTWLEQGWAVTVSAGVLGAVARVLRLTPAERDHPYLFAGQPTRRVTRVTSTISTVPAEPLARLERKPSSPDRRRLHPVNGAYQDGSDAVIAPATASSAHS